ncbi:imidazolonepropionase [Leekyejoonella antrihumi]|uniref:Imidazolonepropionase n=1 Tax=Leekyejoonella antrihumi TaxID=1660198 RepID=A0A563E006_9MICO|nr:imidazolonepropionase [Leekyejoonella antrihumi]
MRRVDLLVTGAAEILTCASGARDLIGSTIGGVAVDHGFIVAVGDVSGYTAEHVVDAGAGVVMPGFVDAHTHVVFGGSRAQEYVARCAGLEPPPGAPVGIAGTMTSTRGVSQSALERQAAQRLVEMLAHGTTTVESKSGYGLDDLVERSILDTNRALPQRVPVDIVSTYLGAHACPPDTDQGEYVDLVVDMCARVGAKGLAQFCDVYCDDGYFDLVQTERILHAGLDAGLAPKIHLDAYSHTGAAALAAEVGATSVDHLNFTTNAELTRLAASGITGVYLPCLEYAVNHPNPLDPRRVLDAGMNLALATDICPGCWSTSMQLAIQMACRSGGLSISQALRAATIGSAAAVGRADRVGSIEVGKQADLIVLDIPSHEDMAYRLGRNSVTTVIRRGKLVRSADPTEDR